MTLLALLLVAAEPGALLAGVVMMLLQFVQLDDSQHADATEPESSNYANVIQLDRSEYSEVR